MTTYTVDARDVFTVHKAGCAHLRGAAAQFDIVADDSRAAVLDQLDEFIDGDPDDFIAFGPCLKDLP